MKPISLEFKEFSTKPAEKEGLSLNKRILLKDIIIKIERRTPNTDPIRMEVEFMDGSSISGRVSYATFFQTVPFQFLFLDRKQAKYFEEKYSNYVSFKFTNSDADNGINVNLAAYEFDDEKEREIFLWRLEHERVRDGSFPDHADAW